MDAGSSFSKVKLQHGWLTVGLNGVARTIFLPFYIKWLVILVVHSVFYNSILSFTFVLNEVFSIVFQFFSFNFHAVST